MSQANTTPYCTIAEAAARSGLSVYFWRQLVRADKVPYIRSGSKYYINYPGAMEALHQEEQGN